MNDSKKAREQRYLLQLKACLPDFPDGTINSSESPDFLVGHKSAQTGIEVTRLFRPVPQNARPLQEQETLQQQAVSRAQRLFEGAGPQFLDVTFLFRSDETLTKGRVPGLAEDLCAAVGHMTPGSVGTISEEIVPPPIGSGPPELAWARVSLLPELTRGSWKILASDYMAPLTTTLVQERIDEKTARYSAYRTHCASVWLLIVVDTARTSSIFGVPNDVQAHRYDSPFDRTYLLLTMEDRAIRIHSVGTEEPGAAQ